MTNLPYHSRSAIRLTEDEIRATLQKWREGDEFAASTIIREVYPCVSRVVHTYLPQRESEQDMAQEIFMKIFARLDQFKGDSPFEHWVSRIARTTCIDRLRKQRVRPEVRWTELSDAERLVFEEHPEQSAPVSRPNSIVAARDLLDRLLSTIPAENRQLIMMVDAEGQSLPEVSKATGWGLPKIKMRLHRLRLQLREKLLRLEKSRGSE